MVATQTTSAITPSGPRASIVSTTSFTLSRIMSNSKEVFDHPETIASSASCCSGRVRSTAAATPSKKPGRFSRFLDALKPIDEPVAATKIYEPVLKRPLFGRNKQTPSEDKTPTLRPTKSVPVSTTSKLQTPLSKSKTSGPVVSAPASPKFEAWEMEADKLLKKSGKIAHKQSKKSSKKANRNNSKERKGSEDTLVDKKDSSKAVLIKAA